MNNFLLGIILLLFSLTFMVSCGGNYVYNQSVDIADSGWTYQDSINFDAEILDTLKQYNLVLNIDHSDSYAFQNCYLMISTTLPDGQRLSQQLNVDFAEKTGEWFGKCSGGHCQLKINMQQNAYFNQVGKYQFTIAQFMRKNPLEGIKRINLQIEDTGVVRE